MWGGVQPGIYRVDAAPRLSMRVRNNMSVHIDWRQRLAGNAAPGSGPAITLAGDFYPGARRKLHVADLPDGWPPSID